MFQRPMYTRNLTSVRMFMNGTDEPKFKIVRQNIGRNAVVDYEEKEYTEKCSANDYKLFNNICRAKSKILDYGYSNHWDFFFTQTLDPKKYRRDDLKKFIKDFTQFIRDLRKKYKCEFKYLIIPELHKDGQNWHIHGLISGVPDTLFEKFNTRRKLPQYVKNNADVLNCPLLEKKFGFTTVEPLRDSNKAVSYITKYITKELSYCVSELNLHMFYSSNGLNTSEVLKKGIPDQDIPFTFENDYCSILWIDDIEQVQKIIDSLEVPF